MGDIQEAIVVVLAIVHVAGEVAVVDPDVGSLRLLDANSITEVGLYVLNGQVANNDVRCVDGESKAIEDY